MTVAAAHAAHAATLADKPVIAPPAPWVRPAAPPADDGKADEAAVRLLLIDQQLHLTRDGADLYTETVMKVQTPQGLSALGTITLPWKPDTGTLTVHKLHIIRAGTVIDLLASGPGFTVLRRENNLEYAALDGVLTAVLQPEGLQVGDILDVAMTARQADPALAGHPEGMMGAWANLPIAHVLSRAIWDGTLPIRWRTTDNTPAMKEARAGGTTEITLAADNLQPVLYPRDAPPRFLRPRLIETSGYANWSDLSAVFAPLYVKAATLAATSPLKAEIARIAAASPDPARRAELALALVQDQVRYVFLGMNDGGLVPAAADVTWQRRFGDCKGKTALLLALLHGLGIDAEPAIVSTQFGDGLDRQLPMVALFDHILVRAAIAGKVYWIDGTRTGDRRLADVIVPPFRWALPVRPSGATLEPLVMTSPERPLSVTTIRIDASGGIAQPAPIHAEAIVRGDPATGFKLAFANMTPEVRDRALREIWTKQYDFVTIASVAATYDDATGEERLVMDGTAKMDWSHANYEADDMAIGYSADFTRTAGPHQDAPFAVGFPAYDRNVETIVLPNGGAGFSIDTPDVDCTVAGVEYHRQARLRGATYTVEKTARSIAPEFPASQAAADQQALRDLAKQRVFLNVGAAYRQTPKEVASVLATEPTTYQEFMTRAATHAGREEWALAIADFTRAAALDPKRADPLIGRGMAQAALGRPAPAIADINRAVEVDPTSVMARTARGGWMLSQGRAKEALADADAALARDPANVNALAIRRMANAKLGRTADVAVDDAKLRTADPGIRATLAIEEKRWGDAIPDLDKALAQRRDNGWFLLWQRAQAHEKLGHHDQALADSGEALRQRPDQIDIYLLRANIYNHMGQPDRAVAEATAAVTANPTSDYAHVVAASTYATLHHDADAAREFDKAIALKPTAYAYLTRASHRPPRDVAGRRAEIDAAYKLEPDNDDVVTARIGLQLAAKDWSGLLDSASAQLRRKPRDVTLLTDRGIANLQLGHATAATADFAATRAMIGKDARSLNDLCWFKATHGVALDSALEDCDAALRLDPTSPNTTDSRGFVLLRLGRYAESIRAYDLALSISPKSAPSLFGRGLAEAGAGREEAATADLAAAGKADGTIDAEFKSYGLTP